jgi:hypothetical protein
VDYSDHYPISAVLKLENKAPYGTESPQ